MLYAVARHNFPAYSTPSHATCCTQPTPCNVMPHHSMPHHSTPCHTTPLHATPHHSTPLHATPNHASIMLHHAKLSQATQMSCNAMPYATRDATPNMPQEPYATQFPAISSHAIPNRSMPCHGNATPFHVIHTKPRQSTPPCYVILSMQRHAIPHHPMPHEPHVARHDLLSYSSHAKPSRATH